MLAQLDQLQSAGLQELVTSGNREALEAWRIKYLGTKGLLKTTMAQLKDVPKTEKPAVGKRLNEVKAALESAYEQKQQSLATIQPAGPLIDVTEPGIATGQGRRHVLSRTIDEISDVFARMGLSVAEGPEVEDEWHNFTALNIPPDHPARDPADNFYLQSLQVGGGDGAASLAGPNREQARAQNQVERGASLLLRSQTSTVQIRAMERSQPPLKVIAIGRVYRPDTHDATHFSMFHQVEGLYIDRDVTMVDLKTTLFQFARAYFGEEAEVRIRPSFFPFTEPSAEVDMKMKVKGQYQWVELGGCGMVDPNVLRAVGYDPEEWSGFAFGLGIERIAMRKYGIADIRWLFDNDARFLRQF
jgi:phenylalanyl-tRNA synthetase alpha chain